MANASKESSTGLVPEVREGVRPAVLQKCVPEGRLIMILALVPAADLSMWRRAAQLLPAPGLIRVEDLQNPSSAIDECDAVLVDARGASVPALPSFPKLIVDLEGLCPFPRSHFFWASLNFEAERFGGYKICHLSIRVMYDRSIDVALPDFLPTTGPGVEDEGETFVTWPTAPFEGLGVRVSRDEPTVIKAVFDATRGNGPLWVKPGFPFLVSAKPLSFPTLDGRTVEGLLCTSVTRAGGWMVLERKDVLELLGHDGDVSWDQISKIIGFQPAAALLGWLCATVGRSLSRPDSAG